MAVHSSSAKMFLSTAQCNADCRCLVRVPLFISQGGPPLIHSEEGAKNIQKLEITNNNLRISQAKGMLQKEDWIHM